ncbi:MAG: mannose-6-phosphate isomerase, class I [Flavicella sp.]
MIKLYSLKGTIQEYAWGGTSFISSLLGTEKNDRPKAEYWLGAHENAPSKVFTNNGVVFLNDFIAANPNSILGQEIANDFGRLPFLFKVLDVKGMLSIQVHPSKKFAELGFQRENELKIPLTARHRNYKDDNHKPEIMIALSDFWLLHGFLPENKLISVLKNTPEFNSFLTVFENEGYNGFYKEVLELPIEASNAILDSLAKRILPKYRSGELEKSAADYWAAKAIATASDPDNYDIGIFSIYFFNLVQVHKGEGIFQDAGVPHAYLEGQNIELMANSDNVLRCGLTPKHIDIPELLQHVVFEATHPEILQGSMDESRMERRFETIAKDFLLSELLLEEGAVFKASCDAVIIMIVTEGEVEVSTLEQTLKVSKGGAFLLTAGASYTIKSKEKAILYKATTPN